MLKQSVLRWVPYCWATAAVALALGVRLLMDPWLGENRPFLTFLTAVAAAAWVGGRRTAIFAVMLSYFAANYFLMFPKGTLYFDHNSASDWANVGIFVALSWLIVVPILAMQRAQRQTEASAAKVEQLLAAAMAADRQKDRFLATLAHELRNPLAAISYSLQLWPHVSGDAAETENLRAAMSRQFRLISRLVDDLMDVARFHRGALRLQKDKVDLTALLGHAIESVRPNLDKRGHQFHIDLAASPIFVDGDSLRLNQVFLNILDNAIKYTGRDGKISMTLRQQGQDAVVRIRDNGPGISESMLASVFEMFSQASGTLDHASGGLGIGLFLVKQLVTTHGGTVEAHSDGLGTGSEFVVTLPAWTEPCLANRVAEPPKLASPCARRRVLVVDDVKESADALAKILGSIGHDATPLYDGESAVPWILAHLPDIVFLDIAMPGLNGYEVARRLRGHAELRTTLLIALTAFGQPEDKRRALESGFQFHMVKPAKLEDLEALLQDLPRRAKPTAEASVL